MDFDGTQWWVDYSEDGEYKRNYYNDEESVQAFYVSLIN
jgi:hypothetical protein